MKNITDLEWFDENISHIARHQVKPEEVEQLCFSQDAMIEQGRGENIYYLTGQTESGRYLFVVLRTLGRGRARVITARDLEKNERSRYRKRR